MSTSASEGTLLLLLVGCGRQPPEDRSAESIFSTVLHVFILLSFEKSLSEDDFFAFARRGPTWGRSP
jgi:hypothetical protein